MLIGKAREVEMQTVWNEGVYVYDDMRNARRDAEAIIIDTTWVDITKGTEAAPDWRSRLRS